MEERKEQLAIHNETYMADAPLSDEARMVVEAAKTDEAAHAQQLRYNPYEMMKGTGQQASNTVTNITHAGSIDAGASAGATSSSAGATRPSTRTSANQDAKRERKQEISININPTFDDAFTSLVTTNTSEEQVKKSLRIMRKLISNATTAKDAASFTLF